MRGKNVNVSPEAIVAQCLKQVSQWTRGTHINHFKYWPTSLNDSTPPTFWSAAVAPSDSTADPIQSLPEFDPVHFTADVSISHTFFLFASHSLETGRVNCLGSKNKRKEMIKKWCTSWVKALKVASWRWSVRVGTSVRLSAPEHTEPLRVNNHWCGPPLVFTCCSSSGGRGNY